ncbi:multidrug transporter, partial [Pseudomonas syringae pv. actinidiae ICMP 18807]
GQMQAIARLADPQVLLQHTPTDIDTTLQLARTALAQAVGTGLMICAALGVLALVVLYRLPRVTLYQAPRTAIPATESAEKHAS